MRTRSSRVPWRRPDPCRTRMAAHYSGLSGEGYPRSLRRARGANGLNAGATAGPQRRRDGQERRRGTDLRKGEQLHASRPESKGGRPPRPLLCLRLSSASRRSAVRRSPFIAACAEAGTGIRKYDTLAYPICQCYRSIYDTQASRKYPGAGAARRAPSARPTARRGCAPRDPRCHPRAHAGRRLRRRDHGGRGRARRCEQEDRVSALGFARGADRGGSRANRQRDTDPRHGIDRAGPARAHARRRSRVSRSRQRGVMPGLVAAMAQSPRIARAVERAFSQIGAPRSRRCSTAPLRAAISAGRSTASSPSTCSADRSFTGCSSPANPSTSASHAAWSS